MTEEMVEWTHNEVTYQAIKLTAEEHDMTNPAYLLGKILEKMLDEGELPTKIIASSSQIRDIEGRSSEIIHYTDSPHTLDLLDCRASKIPLQGDSRVDEAIYILFTNIDPADLRAEEFGDMQELP